MKRRPTAYPGLVRALAGTGVPWAQIAREAGVRGTWITDMRNGGGTGPQSAPHLRKLQAWLKKYGIDVEVEALPVPGQKTIPVDAANPKESTEAINRLATMSRGARTHEACGEALAYLSELLVRGVIDRFTAGAIESTIKTRQASVKLEDEERRRLDKDKPVELVVKYENDWLRKLDPNTQCPLCLGTGLKAK